jgi:hypothetical protein
VINRVCVILLKITNFNERKIEIMAKNRNMHGASRKRIKKAKAKNKAN